jgi:hypothetical protein
MLNPHQFRDRNLEPVGQRFQHGETGTEPDRVIADIARHREIGKPKFENGQHPSLVISTIS